MKKGTIFALSWLGAITVPYLVRKGRQSEDDWTGTISTLHIGESKEIGYYIFPGIFTPAEETFKNWLLSNLYDLNLVYHGHKDYDPDVAALKVANHIQRMGYEKVRIISISLGDQLLSPLGYYLREMVFDERIEIGTFDSLPNSEFVAEKYQRSLRAGTPVLTVLRILGGWLMELPLIHYDNRWRSPAEIIEPISQVLNNEFDYTNDPIFECIKFVVKDGNVFYDPENADELFRLTYDFETDDNSVDTRLYFNSQGDLANIQDPLTISGYARIFEDVGWTF